MDGQTRPIILESSKPANYAIPKTRIAFDVRKPPASHNSSRNSSSPPIKHRNMIHTPKRSPSLSDISSCGSLVLITYSSLLIHSLKPTTEAVPSEIR